MSNESENDKIPLKIFQTWHTKDLTEKMRETVEELKNSNQEFEHFLFDENECAEFIRSHFDERVVNAFNRLIPIAFKADLWRYCVLYIHGGIYLDIKFRCVNGFKFINIIDKEHFVLDCLLHPYGDEPYKGVWNAFMVTKPKSEKMHRCIHQIVENVENNDYCNGPYDVTGPVLLGNCFTIEEKKQFNMKRWMCSGDNGAMLNDLLVLDEYKGYRDENSTDDYNKYYLHLWWSKKVFKCVE
jgi:mannosyltransferase OCH1-like enzyme